MIKKGEVKSVQANGSWDGKYGTMYKYEVTIGDDTGEYSSKSQQQDKFVIGKVVDYEVTEQGNFGKKIKPVSNFQSGGGFSPRPEDPDRQRMIVKQSSLKVASDLCIANDKADLNSVFKVAERIVEWVMEKPSVHTKPTASVVKPKKEKVESNFANIENFAEQSGQTAFPNQDDGLPF